MFFVMADTIVGNKVYQRRVGAATQNLTTAIRKARVVKGYVQNENGDMVAQAFNENLPRYVDAVVNIGSGEDAYV